MDFKQFVAPKNVKKGKGDPKCSIAYKKNSPAYAAVVKALGTTSPSELGQIIAGICERLNDGTMKLVEGKK